MTRYTGTMALEYLAGRVSLADPGASSHWRTFHSAFRFSGTTFSGLQGFGGHDSPYRGPRRWMHRALQRRYRRVGSGYPSFPSMDALAAEITRSQDRAYDLDVLRQTLTVAYLQQKLPAVLGPEKTACVIGDGFGSLTALLLASRSAETVVLVNLTKTLLVDLWYLRLWMGADRFAESIELVTDEEAMQAARSRPNPGRGRIIAVQAADWHLLGNFSFDFVVNVASMQEMDPPVIEQYFTMLRDCAARRPLVFYCCNREEKVLPDGTMVRFADYPWREEDEVLDEGYCPWHQEYYAAWPPFYRQYDGPVRHRLAQLAPETSVQKAGTN